MLNWQTDTKNNSIKNFFDEYLKRYPKENQEDIRYYVSADTYFSCRSSELMQIYTYLNLLPEDVNYYYGLFDLLCELHDLSGNILDIAGGSIPVFADILSKYQAKISCGTITIMDPKLIFEKFGNLALVKKEYSKQENISAYNLITAIKPCKATIPIIKGASYYKKNLFLAMCGCEHYEQSSDKTSEVSWENYIYSLLKDNFDNSCSIEKHTLAKKYRLPNSIFSVKHK